MRSLLACCLLAASFLTLTGCGTMSPPPPPPPEIRFTAANRPTFAVAYHPYGPSLPRHLAAPLPNYTNWTNERMGRDLRRFQEVGFGRVFVCLTTDQVNDGMILDRMLYFLSEADRLGGPQVAMLVGSGETPLVRDALARRLLSVRIQASRQAVQEGGRPVVYLRPGVNVVGESHPALLFQTMPKDEWHWAVSGRVVGRDLQREHGHILLRSMWEGYAKRRPVIVVTWNDFSTGDFVEPNSHDGAQVAELVQEEIKRIEDMVLAVPRGSRLAD